MTGGIQIVLMMNMIESTRTALIDIYLYSACISRIHVIIEVFFLSFFKISFTTKWLDAAKSDGTRFSKSMLCLKLLFSIRRH